MSLFSLENNDTLFYVTPIPKSLPSRKGLFVAISWLYILYFHILTIFAEL